MGLKALFRGVSLPEGSSAVHLKQLKLSGFKSFADPTTIEFPSALCGIVGPNGCGKSNVIDAIRWVLGEGRASELRGQSSMTDLIFAGSEGRPPASRASVEMVLDNSDGQVKGPWEAYAELAIRRVVTKDGTNAYFINGQQVRRRDVQDIFLGTGLGPRSYAIISQGMVNKLLEAKPEDLRVYLEEAAGVSKYKERRRETETSLAATRANLEKVAVLQANKAEEVERLTKEAETAKAWQALENERLHAESLWYFVQEKDCRDDINRLTAQIVAKEAEQIEASGKLAGLADEETKLKKDAETKKTVLEKARSASLEANNKVIRAEADIRHLIEQRRMLEERIGQAEARLTRHRDAKDDAEHRVSELAAHLEELAAAEEEAAAEVEGLAEETEERRAAAEEARGQYEEARGAVNDAEKTMSAVSVEVSALAREADQLDEQIEALKAEKNAADAPDESECTRLGEALEEKRAALEEETALLEELTAAAETSAARLETAREAKNTAQNRLAALEARLEALTAVQEKARAEGKLPQWLEKMGLAGSKRFFERVHIAEHRARAVEAVLSVRAQALGVTQLERVAGFTFDPPPARLVFHANFAPQVTLPAAPEGWERLSDAVTTDDATLRPVIDRWLGGAFVAKDLNEALARRRELPSDTRFVTPEGHIVEPQSVSFWAEENPAAGLLSRMAEIETLTHDAETAREAVTAADGEVVRAKAALDADRSDREVREGTVETLKTEIHRTEVEYSKLVTALAAWRARQGKITESLSELTVRQEELAAKREETEAKFSELDEKLSDLQQAESTAQTALEEAEQAETLTEERRQTVSRRAEQLKMELQASAVRKEDARRLAQASAEEIEMAAAEIEELRAGFEGLNEAEEREGLQQFVEELQRLEAEQSRAQAAADAADNALQALFDKSRALQALQAPLLQAISDIKVKRAQSETNIEIFTARLEELKVDRFALAAEVESEKVSADAARRRVKKFEQQIVELGSVNHAALQTLEASRRVMEETERQVKDLEEAIANLEATIREIDAETRDLLKNTFDAVNANFSEVFRSLFGGGNAYLEMTGEEILEAGVEINAQPPGKKNKTISLLSGGEKSLTATALTFAIFKLNPAPFCLLDEVDAPLDEANQDRLARQIVAMSAQTQFAMITHLRVTMEKMGQLIGVTMKEPGVSRVVAVDIKEAVKVAG